MKTFRFPFYFVTGLLVAAFVLIVVQYNTAQRLTKQMADLGSASTQAEDLRKANKALTDDLKQIVEKNEVEHRELLRLRGQVAGLRVKEKEVAGLKAERERMTQQLQAIAPPSTTPPLSEQIEEQRRTARMNFSRQLGLSMMMFAADHDNQLPASFDQIDTSRLSAVPESAAHNIKADQFEMLYKGRLNDLSEPGRTVMGREKEPVQNANGTWERVYFFADGHSEVVAADRREHFLEHEKQRFVFPVNP